MQVPDLILMVVNRVKKIYLEWKNNGTLPPDVATSNNGTVQESNSIERRFTRVAYIKEDSEANIAQCKDDITKLRQDIDSLNHLIRKVDRRITQRMDNAESAGTINIDININKAFKKELDKRDEILIRKMSGMERKFERRIKKVTRTVEYHVINL